MRETRADVIFHPVRIRAVQALFGGRRLTAQQLVEVMEGPSIATLYRHLNKLVQAGIVAVVEERPVRGAVEKVYALAHDHAARFTPEDTKQTSREDRMRHFNTLIGTLLNDFGRYLGQEEEARRDERFIIRQEALYVSDEEAARIGKVIREALTPYLQHAPDASRRRQMVTLISLPVLEPTQISEEAGQPILREEDTP